MTARPELVTASAGVHCLPLPTPFPVGPINTYLLEGDPLTLVDCGPSSADALVELERALGERGHAIEDLELVFITHQHLDHAGLAPIVARRSGAPVACLDRLAGYLEDFQTEAERDDEHARLLMIRHGLEEHVATAIGWANTLIRGWGAAVAVDRPIPDGGQIVAGDRALQVLHRPGHSPSDTVLYDADHRLLLAGDHLLERISSNAVLSRPLGAPADGARRRPLVEYRDSLRATAELDVDLVLTGHGAPVHDHRALIERRLVEQEDRAARLLDRLVAGGPATAYELATAIWGDAAITQALMTISEVVGHLDLLIDAGTVAEDGTGAVVRFHAA
jgi:glyoxylase-like metal-dependent hydrolase (beta-lactamase superfamily II)